jgi:hypothetical protein
MMDRHNHPLRAGLTIPGGLLVGLGAGLAFGHVAAGVLAGLGVGMLWCACLRAFGKWYSA